MKTLYLVRHADAIGNLNASISDMERSLVPKGEKKAKKTAKKLKKRMISPDIILSSPATRALSTAHIIAEILHYPIEKITLERVIYEGNSHDFLAIVNNLKPQYSSAMIVGHEPTLSSFASLLAEEFHSSLPKSAIVGISFPKDNWEKLQAGEGKITLFDFPNSKSELPEIRNTFRKEIKEKIYQNLSSFFEEIDEETGRKMRQKIKQTSKQLAREFIEISADYCHHTFSSKLTQSYCQKFPLPPEKEIAKKASVKDEK